MRYVLPFFLCAAALHAGAVPSGAKAEADTELTPAELARSRELQDLAHEEKALYEEFAKTDGVTETRLPQADKERRVKSVMDRYEALLKDDPTHIETILLYGKFLRRVDERELAYRMFMRADRLAPDIAVVKHQLGAHLAENGRAAEARPLLLRAIELAPEEPRYRYDYGEFLAAAASLVSAKGPLTREARDREMMETFHAAARLKPSEAGYRWRAAEAWYDVQKPDADAALAEWTALAKEAKSPDEKEVTGLHRARWLIALGRSDEARKLIRASTTPALDATRRKLLDELSRNEPGFRDIGKDPTRR